MTPVNLYPLRAALSESEIARYRWLGAETAAATVESLHQVEPGLSEYDLEAITAANLLRRGILPSVYLFAVDDRILQVQACGGARQAAEAVRHAESLLAQVGPGDFDHAICAFWRTARRAWQRASSLPRR